ncbi:hypothetical protein LTS18_010833, partial [Coniosporium uncinatum]
SKSDNIYRPPSPLAHLRNLLQEQRFDDVPSSPEPPVATPHTYLWLIAISYHTAHAYPLAIKHYKRALRLHPPTPTKWKLWFNIAQAQRSLNDHYLATQYLQQAVLLAPSEPLYWYALGAVAVEMRQWRKAAKWFSACLCVVAPDVAGVKYVGENLEWEVETTEVMFWWRHCLARWKRREKGNGRMREGEEWIGVEASVSCMPTDLVFGPV